MYKLILALMCIAIMGCSNPSPYKKKSRQSTLIDKVSEECAQTLSKRHGMIQSSEAKTVIDQVQGLSLSFNISRQLSKNEARGILIDCAHELITTVNNDPSIQDYLLLGGFTEKNVQIQISIHPNYKRSFYPDLGTCSFKNGKLTFKTRDSKKIYKSKTKELETYQEAIAFLKAPYIIKDSNNNPKEALIQ